MQKYSHTSVCDRSREHTLTGRRPKCDHTERSGQYGNFGEKEPEFNESD